MELKDLSLLLAAIPICFLLEICFRSVSELRDIYNIRRRRKKQELVDLREVDEKLDIIDSYKFEIEWEERRRMNEDARFRAIEESDNVITIDEYLSRKAEIALMRSIYG